MSDTHQLLNQLIRAIRSLQSDLDIVSEAVYAASMKEALSYQQQELDLIESDILTAADCRGWELTERLTFAASFSQAKLRLRLQIGCSDSRIARLMIFRYTESTSRILTQHHSSAAVDRHIKMLVQKLTDCHSASIRQLQKYL